MKQLIFLFALLFSYAGIAQQVDTAKWVDNVGLGYKYNGWYVKKTLVVPVKGRWSVDTTNKVPGALQVIGNSLYYVGTNGFWNASGGGGTTYSAGYGLKLTTNVFLADTFTLATRAFRDKGMDSLGALIPLAGYGIDNLGGMFHVDTALVQKRMNAGTGIAISGNTIYNTAPYTIPTLQQITDNGGGFSTTTGDIVVDELYAKNLVRIYKFGTNTPISLSASNVTGAVGKLLYLPNADAVTLAVSVNGVYADANGNIPISGIDTTNLSARVTTNVTAVTDLQNRNIATSFGLTGGGNLTTDRTLNVDTFTVQRRLAAGTGIAISGNTLFNTGITDTSNLSARVTTNVNAITANTANIALKAPIASPTFTGTVTMPTGVIINSGSANATLSITGTTAASSPYAQLLLGRSGVARYSYITHESNDNLVVNHYNGTSFIKSIVVDNGNGSVGIGGSSMTNTGANAVLYVKSNGLVGIGNTNPNSSTMLDIVSTSRGVSFPRMTTAQRDAISSPVTSLTLFCTDCTATDASTGVMQTYNGSTWKNHW